MKKHVAMLCMAAFAAMPVWSQKPQTGFSDLNRCAPRNCKTQSSPSAQSYFCNMGFDDDIYFEDRAWTCTSYLNLGYAYDQQLRINDTDYGCDSKWGASLQIGNSYMLPRKAFFDMVKIGIDATWLDLSGTQYDLPGADFYQITAGMGIGASLHIAPFTHMSEGLRPLRFEGYCRFVPSYSLLLHKSKYVDEDYDEPDANDWKSHGAFLPVVSFGFAVDYRAIGIGYEHRTGGAKYKDFADDSQKTKFDMTSNRVYISWRM